MSRSADDLKADHRLSLVTCDGIITAVRVVGQFKDRELDCVASFKQRPLDLRPLTGEL